MLGQQGGMVESVGSGAEMVKTELADTQISRLRRQRSGWRSEGEVPVFRILLDMQAGVRRVNKRLSGEKGSASI